MANSTTNIPQLSFGMADKETQVNELFDAASPAMLYGRNALTTTGLTWGYLGGRFNDQNIANGTIALTASATNYIEADASTGTVSKSTGGWTTGKRPLYSIVTGASAVTSYQDFREASGGGSLSLPVSIEQGGTGATDAAGAREKLGVDAAIALGSWSTCGGIANAITLTPVVPRTAYARGDEFRFRATAINTGATTINVAGLGTKTAVTVTGAALPAGYIRTDVDTVCVYDGTRFVVQREIERGSNANGNYTRWADGTQICRGARILASSNNAGNQVTLPAAFRDDGYVCLAAGSIASGSIAASNVYEVENQSSSQVLIKALIHTPSSILDGVDARARFAATGEWY